MICRVLMLEGTPAEEALLITPEGGSQLYTPVTGYAIKLVLVAHLPPGKSPFTPEAGFQGC